MQFVFPRCRVLVDEDARYVETRFDDGTKVGSTPNVDLGALLMGADLGYGEDTWRMSRDHEMSHTWLAHLDRRPWSPTMWRLAHPHCSEVAGDAEVAEEEAQVLAFQRRLDKAAERPWEACSTLSKLPLPW